VLCNDIRENPFFVYMKGFSALAVMVFQQYERLWDISGSEAETKKFNHAGDN